MKIELAPQHSQKIGDNHVLWFESSNSYVVLSTTAYQLLTFYLESDDKHQFTFALQQHLNFTLKQTENCFSELTDFLMAVHKVKSNDVAHDNVENIPDNLVSIHYDFGHAKIRIGYGSEKLIKLIHPYISHLLSNDENQIDAEFAIFTKNGLIHLFKNGESIAHYDFENFHFLQGKFTMELVTSIYKNTVSDWMATFHSSTITNGEEAIMIIGASGSGKSTLSAVLMAKGFDLLADDFSPMLAENQHLYRFPSAISIKTGAFKIIEDLFPNFESYDLQKSISKPTNLKYLPPLSSFHTSNQHFECNKVVLVKYDNNAVNELKVCPSEKILQTLIPDSWISPQEEHSKLFLNWLKNLKFYELNYCDNNFAVSAFKELFKM
ncbi:hypothetical protein M0G43_06640 [Subsaxibacter sp. CAU 1640]|uniref:hypothetical protein n=1 Tax=Subsaxibacter sp. CAU 1640 TaxID=2933271 RepID=UPI002005927D|nr:hypothetical protein [Subsaxibacter sp. CAU 1640]MCK7590243.1 hypothetical protein [Subsaxibacter sp. CAU 1640]